MEWLTSLGYSLGTFFLVIGVVILVMGKFSSNAVTTTSAIVTNETPAYSNSTGYTLLKATDYGFTNPTITAGFNATNGSAVSYATIIPLGNFSVSSTGVLKNATALSFGNISISYTYTYTTEDNASQALNYGMQQLGEGGLLGWAPAIIAIVIGVFFLSYFIGGSGKRYR